LVVEGVRRTPRSGTIRSGEEEREKEEGEERMMGMRRTRIRIWAGWRGIGM
jgi:hypothetical protein